MHALDMIAREREHVAESERLKLQAQLAEMVEDVNKKILTKEIKLREEIQDKSLQLEKVCSSWVNFYVATIDEFNIGDQDQKLTF